MKHVHMVAAKHVLRYLKGTMDYGLKYDANKKVNLHGYVDSDWEINNTDRKSTLGFYFSLRSGMIFWFTRKKSYVVLNPTKGEYVATCLPSCEVVWLRNLLCDLFVRFTKIKR